MTDRDRTSTASRERLLALLTDDEIAKVSTAETASALAVGEDYLDLEHPERGVQRVTAETRLNVAQSLPRGTVSDATWGRLLSSLVQ